MASSKIVEISAGRLRVDPDIQRGLKPRRVAQEAARFSPNGLGVITVSDRGNGDLVVVDGQHRVEIVKKAEGASYKMTAKVFTGLTRQEEAALFRVLNNMEKVGSLDGFRVRLAENDPVAVFLKKIVENHGWPLGPGPRNTHFNAVAALERVYWLDSESDPTAAERAIATLTQAWGHAEGTVDGRLIEGLGRFYARHKQAADAGGLTERLAKGERGPAQFIGAARTLRALKRGAVTDAVAEIFTDVYNLRRTAKTALPDWRA